MRLAAPILLVLMGLGTASAQTDDIVGASHPEAAIATAPPQAPVPSNQGGAVPSNQAGAVPSNRCLSRQEQRSKAAARLVVPLSKAVRGVRARGAGELIGARLCERNGKLVYLLTLLARDGKVLRTTVDAGNGGVIGGR